MISIQLKTKHFYVISDVLFGTSAQSSFELLNRIKEACEGLQDDDLASVDVSVDHFVRTFQSISMRTEGSHNMINTEMMNLLTPQISAGVLSGNSEWIQLAEKVTEIRNSNWEILNKSIANAKHKLYNQG